MKTHILQTIGWALLIILLILPAGAAAAEPSRGWYNIHCNVDGASIYFDGEYKGLTADGILLVSVQTTGTPYTKISAEKSGYESASALLTPARTDETVDISIELIKLPPPASLNITSSPAGASVLIDSTLRGETPLTLTDLKADKLHIVTVRLTNYEDWKTTITILPESSKTLSASLKPLADQNVYIDSVPQGVNLYVDGRYYGITPKTIDDLMPGDHTVRLSVSGYEEKTETISIVRDQDAPFTITLQPLTGQPGTGTIKVVSSPGGADIYLDSVFQNKVTPDTITGVLPGSHRVLVRLAGYEDSSTNVIVADGKITSASLALPVAATPTKAPGMLWISALAGILVVLAARRIYR